MAHKPSKIAVQTENQTMPDAKPKPADIEVVNPRYKGATFEMVVKAMLQRPRKADQEGDGDPSDEPESDSAQSTT